MKKIIITIVVFLGIVSIVLVSCQKNNQTILDDINSKKRTLRLLNSFTTNINNTTFKHFANLGHTENISENEKSEIDSFYFSLNPLELKLFLNESNNYINSNLDSKDSTELSSNSFEGITKIESMINLSLKNFDKGFNQLNEIEKINFDELLKQDGKRIRGNCDAYDFPNYTCNTNSFNRSCAGYSRAATKDAINDCDYEFYFYGINHYNHGTTWFAQQVLNWWGSCGIKARYINDSRMTLLVGNGAINVFYWGNAWIFKKRCKMR